VFDKHRRRTLAVALFNLCYMFYIVFLKGIKWGIVPHIIVQMGLPLNGPSLQNKTRLRDWLRNTKRVQWKPTCHSKLCGRHFGERMFVISLSMARSVGYDMKSVRLTEVAIPTIFDTLGNGKSKRISSLMGKQNRKRVCMCYNRVILGAKIGHPTVHAFENNFTYSQKVKIYLGLLKASYGRVLYTIKLLIIVGVTPRAAHHCIGHIYRQISLYFK